MKPLNDRQAEIAIALREILKVPLTDEAWGPFTDFRKGLAQIAEGVENLVTPPEMSERFSQAWNAYGLLWASEHNRILKDCLGEQFDAVRDHPNGKNAMTRILNRVRETYGGIQPGMVVNMDVNDILMDELGEEPSLENPSP